jgi:transcription elongation factor Elf1
MTKDEALKLALEPVAGQPLPCPFCGHIGLDFSDGETYRWGVASCGGCGASCGEVRREYPDKSEWHTEAIAEWNRRSPAAQRTWVGLTDEERQECTQSPFTAENYRAIEAKLKEKNNG